MHINLSNAGKRFNREWIFRKVVLDLYSGYSYAITGPNGSGKSTLLQSIGGMLQLSEGSITYTQDEKKVAAEDTYRHIAFCAPYLDLIEEMTLLEFFQFHFSFKPYLPGMDAKQAVEIIGLKAAANKQIRYYSSGMKQRVKLAQAILCNASVLLLDEPTSNLDKQGIELYHSMVQRFCAGRLVVVSSNDPTEYSFCQQVWEISRWK